MKVPAPPVDVKLSVLSGTSLRVVFSPSDDGGDTITKYLIEYDTVSSFNSPNLAHREHLFLEGGAPYSVTLPQLVMGTEYFVRVAAFNSRGYGPFEASSPASETPAQVPTAPSDVYFLITSDTKLTVTFNDPVSDGGSEITMYKVTWDREPTFSSLFEAPHRDSIDVPASTHRSYTIEGLTPGVNYYVKVQARNAIGYGPPRTGSPSERAPATQLPGKPYNVEVNSGAAGVLDVSFTAPRIPDHGVPCGGGGPLGDAADMLCGTAMGRDHTTWGEADGGLGISKYVLEWDVQEDFVSSNGAPHKGSATILATDPNIFSFTHQITGLAPNRLYFVRIAAENSNGPGQFESKDILAQTLSERPN
jgi:hypothetical protein